MLKFLNKFIVWVAGLEPAFTSDLHFVDKGRIEHPFLKYVSVVLYYYISL